MHINHRRTGHRVKKGTRYGYCPYPYSLKVYRRIFWHRYRAKTRHLMENERYDEIHYRIPSSILYDYW